LGGHRTTNFHFLRRIAAGKSSPKPVNAGFLRCLPRISPLTFRESRNGAYESTYSLYSRIQDRQVANLFNATLFCEAIRQEFTVAMTISWRRRYPAADDQEIFNHHQALMDSIQHWLRYRGVMPAAFWVFERTPKVGLHSHLGIAVPKHLVAAFKEHCIKQMKSDVALPGMPYFRRLARPSDRIRWVSYCLKGVDQYNAAWGPAFEGIKVERCAQGNIKFKRCGLSRGVDKSARAKAGYVDIYNVPELAEFVFDVFHHGLSPDTQLPHAPVLDATHRQGNDLSAMNPCTPNPSESMPWRALTLAPTSLSHGQFG
jgi:hypothetical protein